MIKQIFYAVALGVAYTHVAFWVYSNIELVAGLRGRGTAFTICIKTAKTNHAVR